jgi:hypothetical protein
MTISKLVEDVRKLTEYREARKHIFQSDSALQWFVRKHRQRLIDAGALVLLSGQWHACEKNFDDCVLLVGQDAAKKRAVA